MSLFDGSTYERPDAEVLPLITPESARARGGWGEATPLHEAAWNSSSVAVVQALLAAYPEAANSMSTARAQEGETPADLAKDVPPPVDDDYRPYDPLPLPDRPGLPPPAQEEKP